MRGESLQNNANMQFCMTNITFLVIFYAEIL